MQDLVMRSKRNGNRFAMIDIDALTQVLEWAEQEHAALFELSRLRADVAGLRQQALEGLSEKMQLAKDQRAMDRNATKHGEERKRDRENLRALEAHVKRLESRCNHLVERTGTLEQELKLAKDYGAIQDQRISAALEVLA